MLPGRVEECQAISWLASGHLCCEHVPEDLISIAVLDLETLACRIIRSPMTMGSLPWVLPRRNAACPRTVQPQLHAETKHHKEHQYTHR